MLLLLLLLILLNKDKKPPEEGEDKKPPEEGEVLGEGRGEDGVLLLNRVRISVWWGCKEENLFN